jgi:hypothetical protein
MRHIGCWLEKNDQNEIISRRPLAQRFMFGLWVGPLLWLTYWVVQMSWSSLAKSSTGPALWAAAAFMPLCLILTAACFLNGTSQRRFRLDIQQQRYSLSQGILWWTRTKQGETRGGELSVSRTKSGASVVSFKARQWKSGLPFEFCKTQQDAQSLACDIADKLSLSVRR